MKIALYSRNSIQNIFFKGVTKELENIGHRVDLLFPHFGKSCFDNIFFPENDISEGISDSRIDVAHEFKRIVRQYENINRIIQSERELNYYRMYFRVKPVTRLRKIEFLVHAFCWFEKYLIQRRPDIVVSEMVTGLFDGVFREVCKFNNVQYIGIRSSKIRPGIVFCDDVFDEPRNLQIEYEKNLVLSFEEVVDNTKIDVSNLIHRKILPHYMEVSGKNFRLFSYTPIKTLYNLFFVNPKLPKISIQQPRIRSAIREKIIRLINLNHSYFADYELKSIRDEKNYFVFASHFEPEASVHVRAHNHADQLGLIKQISRILPPDCMLVVKEHRGNLGFRKREFYYELSHLYNVKLASQHVDLKHLVENSHAVITMTGRIGLEALLMNKPVLAFGNSFWTKLPGVITEDSPKSLVHILELLKNENNEFKQKINRKLTLSLLHAYNNLTYNGCFLHGASEFLTSQNFKNVALSLNRFINE